MATRKAFIFRGGDKINSTDKPLQYLDSSLSKLKTTLQEYGKWEVESFVLRSSDDISDKLSSIVDNEDNEILLFYTGHGVPQPHGRYALIRDNYNEVLFDNIINPINKFAVKFDTADLDATPRCSILRLDRLPRYLSLSTSFIVLMDSLLI